MIIRVNIFQNELRAEIYLKSLVRAIGKVLRMTFSSPIETHKDDEKWPLFVNKQLFWWSASITMMFKQDFEPFLSLAASCVPLKFPIYNSHLAHFCSGRKLWFVGREGGPLMVHCAHSCLIANAATNQLSMYVNHIQNICYSSILKFTENKPSLY